MNFYSITLDINDRREHNLELFPQGQDHRLQRPKSFVIDIPNFTHFKIVSAALTNDIKCFVLNEEDIALRDCKVEALRDGNKVLIRLEKKETAKTDFEPAITKPEPKADISFEEIEALAEYNKPKVKTPDPVIAVQETREDLGDISNQVTLAFTSNDYAYKLDAILKGGLSDHQYDDTSMEVIFQLNVKGHIYENSIIVTLSHPASFLGIALDFGSESSQMAVKRYEAIAPFHAQSADNENLFRNIVAYHKNQGWIPRESTYDFYQEEKGTDFYKSLFFLKEQLTGAYKNVDQEPFIKNTAENLKMLVNIEDGFTTLEKAKYYQLPNLKILHKHERLLEDYNFEIEKDGYPITLKLRELKQKVYNSILEIMIVSFLKKEFIRYDNSRRNIRMMLLVPNNYDTKDINKTQHHLNMIFEALSKSEEYQGKIGAWEILTISESDASFIGYINKNNVHIQNNKDYIIIDSGKGTTDFSIIRTGAKNLYNLRPVYRNGFTGAGNMLTYAVFETVMHFIREQNPEYGADVLYIRNKIIDVLKSNDLESRNKFYNQIERLKFNYKEKEFEASIRKSWLEAYDGDINFENLVAANVGIDAVTNLLTKVNGISDFYGYITNACHFIVNNVVSYLKIIKDNKEDLSLSGVVLTGRAFKFRQLADMMKDKLNQDLGIPKDKITLLQGNELKDICIKGVFNNSIKLNAEVTGYPVQLIYKSVQDMPQSEIHTRPKVSLSKKIFNFFINDLADMEHIDEVVSVEDNVNFNVLQRSQFLIGCKRYSIRNDEFLTTQPGIPYTASIDFTQRGFVMRRKIGNKVNYVSALEEIDEGGSGDKSLIVPSLFPNYMDEEYIQSIHTEAIAKADKSGHKNSDPYPPDDYYPPDFNSDRQNTGKTTRSDDNPLFF